MNWDISKLLLKISQSILYKKKLSEVGFEPTYPESSAWLDRNTSNETFLPLESGALVHSAIPTDKCS